MLNIGNTLISDDIKDICFSCDLKQCKGACCVEGDAGAPLLEEEISILEDVIEEIKPYMRPECIGALNTQGVFDYDAEGHIGTSLLNNRDCIFVYFENDIALCAIEKAYFDKKISFQKPISCHLYPIRITQFYDFDALNYHEWDICKPALENGKQLNEALYKFLKEPLIRQYGREWYADLIKEIEKNKP